jgi:hypothetical protein
MLSKGMFNDYDVTEIVDLNLALWEIQYFLASNGLSAGIKASDVS